MPLFVPTPLQTKLFPCDHKYNHREISDLEKSWAQVIKDKVLPFFGVLEIEFARFFHKTMGRPIKYISLLIVVHIFIEMYDWTDEELFANIRFDKRFEYAFELPSRTLQNPSDEEVTCGYKGPGYEATMTETCSQENKFQVITDVQVDPSDQSDQHKTLDVVDHLTANQMKPEQLHTDGGFTSGENIADCADKGVNLQANLVGANKEPDRLKLADFEFARDQATLLSCPAGKKPVAQKREKSRKSKSKSRQSFLVYFDLVQCKRCGLVTDCPAKLQKKRSVLRFSRAQLVSSVRRREQQTGAFKEQNKIRAGVESTYTEMKKSQGLAKLRVRGQPRVNQTVCFKALACNVKRMVKFVQSMPKIDLKFENEAIFATIPIN